MNKQILLYCCILLSATLFTQCKKSNKPGAPVYPTDCARQLAGLYTGSDYCASSGQSNYSSTITASDSINITFSNLYGAPVNAILDCSKNTITIPTQSFPGNFSLSGTGTYTANRIIINWSGLSYGIPINCSSTFTR